MDGLDLVTIEYGQAVKNGKVVEPTEYQAARADLGRAQDAITKAQKDITVVASSASAPAHAALWKAAAVVRQRGGTAELNRAVAAARVALQPLAGAR
jgi:glycine cleavage system protein P-like pyridoxal-binding family